MARPPKNPRLKMSIDLRIPVTAELKQRIMEAVEDEPGGFAAWAREVLLIAAIAKVENRKNVANKNGGSRRVN